VSRRKPPKGLCVYCGVNPATTRDYVIPECLFVPPLPSNMVTVPACADCNTTKKAQDDPYLRDMLVYDSDSSAMWPRASCSRVRSCGPPGRTAPT